ncbi:hypothetical protein NA57DRAFT_58870 [Rhizodiscina lignyota]|uniref:Uncharacterized protein n=1 Tax=Rhizodiscina lignyota TaxID=1504668 RepID=A0A9P4I9U9_9PEZI|nr:hypothetical protein NA57DRAFT_58870 [Rhizodiscina lignyota]
MAAKRKFTAPRVQTEAKPKPTNSIKLNPYARGSAKLEELPNELLQDIWMMSLNLDFPLTSPTLSGKLLNGALRSRFADRLSQELRFSYIPQNLPVYRKSTKDNAHQPLVLQTLHSELMTASLFRGLRARARKHFMVDKDEHWRLPFGHFHNRGALRTPPE